MVINENIDPRFYYLLLQHKDKIQSTILEDCRKYNFGLIFYEISDKENELRFNYTISIITPPEEEIVPSVWIDKHIRLAMFDFDSLEKDESQIKEEWIKELQNKLDKVTNKINELENQKEILTIRLEEINSNNEEGEGDL